MWAQHRVELEPRSRGFHLVTDEITAAVTELGQVATGLLHLHILHTSASLALNEDASADVRADLETWFSGVVPEGPSHWRHTTEGPDDMPAHVKAVLIGPSLTLPVADGGPALGTWQGIYLCEHRDSAGARSVVATLHGE